MPALTARQQLFCELVARPDCRGLTDAYARAGYSTAGKPATTNSRASQLRALPHVAARIDEIQAQATRAAAVDVAFVLREWAEIATADPSELIRPRRLNCRHCHGEGHAYRWRDEDEWAEAAALAVEAEREPPSDAGGYGFRSTDAPHPDCPRCDGDGHLDVYVADIKGMRGNVRKLYAGVKTTRGGIEVKMRDQDAALQSIAKYLGMLKERHEVGGMDGKPIDAKLTLDMDPQQASALYAQLVKGGG